MTYSEIKKGLHEIEKCFEGLKVETDESIEIMAQRYYEQSEFVVKIVCRYKGQTEPFLKQAFNCATAEAVISNIKRFFSE